MKPDAVENLFYTCSLGAEVLQCSTADGTRAIRRTFKSGCKEGGEVEMKLKKRV